VGRRELRNTKASPWEGEETLEGLEGLEGFGAFGVFAGWQTVPLKAIESYAAALALGCLLGKWPWPWGACWEGVWRVWRVLEGFGVLEGVFGGFGWFWRVWSVCGLANGSFERQ